MRVLAIILGLILGILAGFSLLLANPLAWWHGLPPLPADLAPVKTYLWADYRGIRGSAADLLGMPERNPEKDLNDAALRYLRLGVIVLPAGKGRPAALAVKVSAIAEGNALLRGQLGTDDAWNIFWLGEGSVFASGYSNFWNLHRDAFFAELRGGGPELVAGEYALSAPSPLGDAPEVTGASGRYAGYTGEIREFLYTAVPASGAAVTGPEWGVAIKVNPPPLTPR